MASSSNPAAGLCHAAGVAILVLALGFVRFLCPKSSRAASGPVCAGCKSIEQVSGNSSSLGGLAAHVDSPALVLAKLGYLLGKVNAPVALRVAILNALRPLGASLRARVGSLRGAVGRAARGAFFVPFEVVELVLKPGLLSSAILAAKLRIVSILVAPLPEDATVHTPARWCVRLAIPPAGPPGFRGRDECSRIRKS